MVFEGRRVTPSKMVCVGRNYVEHVAELDNELPSEPVLFIKPNSAISANVNAGQGDLIHYEAEICFLLEGGHLVGVGFGLDLTKRAVQSQLKAKGLPWERAKAFDGSAVFSEFVRLEGDMQSLQVALWLNGQPVQRGGVEQMIFKPASIVREISTFMRLEDGDIIMSGTPKGVGVIESGDVLRGSIEQGGRPLLEQTWTAL